MNPNVPQRPSLVHVSRASSRATRRRLADELRQIWANSTEQKRKHPAFQSSDIGLTEVLNYLRRRKIPAWVLRFRSDKTTAATNAVSVVMRDANTEGLGRDTYQPLGFNPLGRQMFRIDPQTLVGYRNPNGDWWLERPFKKLNAYLDQAQQRQVLEQHLSLSTDYTEKRAGP